MNDQGKFPINTAGGRMITSIPCVNINSTIKDVEELLREKSKEFDTLDYIYVTNGENVLNGVISIKKILGTSNKDLKVNQLMDKNLITAKPLTPQERLVYLTLSHGIKAIPIVDSKKRLLGVVPHDIIFKIFNQEVQSDVFKFGGIFHRVGKEFATLRASTKLMIKSRLPWLILGVFGGVIAASVISSFEDLLSNFLVLAAFIPVLVYMSDAVGTQSETLIIRSIALDPKLSLRSYFLREFKVSAALAITCAVIISITAIIGWKNPVIGLIIGFSMFLSIIAAVFISTFFPLVFRKFGYDPAVATGPFATMVSDISTLAIYFTVATLFLDYTGLI